MASILVPIVLLVACALILGIGMLAVGFAVGPRRSSDVKRMPYESGMDPLHSARRRFDFRFHAVAVAFLVFDVELLFLYPWAVANKDPDGLERMFSAGAADVGLSRGLIFTEVMVFVALLAVGLAYAWRKGVFRWR